MKHIHCKVFGHDLKVSKNVTFHVKEYTCKNCNKKFTTNSNGNLIELTPKYQEINSTLEKIHNRRLIRRRKLHPELLVFSH